VKGVDLIRFFGEPSDGDSLKMIFSDLNTLNRPALPNDDLYVYYDWVLVRRKGIELGFVDSEFHRARPRGTWRTGKLLLMQVYFYSGFDNVVRYKEELPFGITWADRRHDVLAKLSAHEDTLHQSDSDTWDVPGYRLTVNYSKKTGFAERVFCRVMPVPFTPPKNIVYPSLQALSQAFGVSTNDPQLNILWENRLNKEKLQEVSEDGEVNFRESFGATLFFSESDASPIFRAITLHRNRDQDAVGWFGDLPFSLTFEDSPYTLFQKVRQAPVQQSNSGNTGHAVWHFSDYTLHILYSRIDNRLIRIKLIAPGVWKCLEDI